MSPAPPGGPIGLPVRPARLSDSPEEQEPPRSERQERLRSLLSDLGPRIRRGNEGHDPLPRCATGFSDVDEILGGGFARGHLSEIAGPLSSGRTSLALSLAAHTTHRGELVAWVDLADAFDPPSAAASGVRLDHVLWARASAWPEALRCIQCLLETEGIPVIVFDLPAHHASAASRTTWLRLSRLAAGTRTALVVLSCERCTDSSAEIALEMQPAQARFTEAPALLEELETRAVLVRHRTRPARRIAPLRLGVCFAA